MSDTFRDRRNAALDQLGESAALVLSATPEIVIGRDTELRYHADAELFYLTGYTEPEAVLVLTPFGATRCTLFVRPRDPARELWTGVRGGVEAAREKFGADEALPISELNTRLPQLVGAADVLYARIGTGRPEVDAAIEQTIQQARRTRARSGHGPLTLTDPGLLLDALRLIKDEHELELMRTAARISAEAFTEVIAQVRGGRGEWEIEAAIEYGFRRRGGDGPAFPSIVASGRNATVLHYVQNDATLEDGQLLLIDAGTRYRMYCADISRTVPVSGKFTSEQRDWYDVVLAAHAAAIAAARPGASADEPHAAAQRVLADGAARLGILQGSADELIESESGLRTIYPHRTSHWLGLDVHDVGAYATSAGPTILQPGMVLTIEPGLYHAERGIGIRIEDDVLITAEGCEVLTASLPTSAAAIEQLMSEAQS